MSIIAWIVLGAVAGFIASKLVNKAGEGLLMDIVLGIVGAVVGGFLLRQFGASGVTGLNFYSLFVAVVGEARGRWQGSDSHPARTVTADNSRAGAGDR